MNSFGKFFFGRYICYGSNLLVYWTCNFNLKEKKNSLVTSVSRYFESKFFTEPTVILRMTFWNIWSLKEIGIKVRGFGKNFYIYWIIKFELLKDFVCKWRRVIRRAGWFWQFFQFFHGIFYAWNFFKLFRVFDI